RILGVDPDRVVVRVRAFNRLPRLAAIHRHLRRCTADEDLLIVDRVYANLAEVSWPLILVAFKSPGLAAIVGAQSAALIRIGRRLTTSAPAAAAPAGCRICGAGSFTAGPTVSAPTVSTPSARGLRT